MIQQEKFIILDLNPKYAVSNLGRIKHLKSDNILNQQVTQSGYMQVMLSFSKNKRKYFRVHRLVGYCFIENLDNKPYINHKDGNKKNNNVNNLEWCTAKENDTHARINGLKFIGTPLKCTNILENTVTVFQSVGEASRFLNVNKSFIHRCLTKQYNKSTYKNYVFEYL